MYEIDMYANRGVCELFKQHYIVYKREEKRGYPSVKVLI